LSACPASELCVSRSCSCSSLSAEAAPGAAELRSLPLAEAWSGAAAAGCGGRTGGSVAGYGGIAEGYDIRISAPFR
jgi:hypothetical protein